MYTIATCSIVKESSKKLLYIAAQGWGDGTSLATALTSAVPYSKKSILKVAKINDCSILNSV